jgi:hypothetical protein
VQADIFALGVLLKKVMYTCPCLCTPTSMYLWLPRCSAGFWSVQGVSHGVLVSGRQIVTRTTPVKHGLLHDFTVLENCPVDVSTLIGDCTKYIPMDRPDTKV